MSSHTSVTAIKYLTKSSGKKKIKDIYAALERVSDLECDNVCVRYSILSTSSRAIYNWIANRYDETKQQIRKAAYKAFSEELKVLEEISPRSEFLQHKIEALDFELHLLENDDKEIEISRETLYELLGHCEQVIAKPELATTLFPLHPYTFDESDLELKIIELPAPKLSPEMIDSAVKMCNEIRDALRKTLRDPFLREASIRCSFHW